MPRAARLFRLINRNRPGGILPHIVQQMLGLGGGAGTKGVIEIVEGAASRRVSGQSGNSAFSQSLVDIGPFSAASRSDFSSTRSSISDRSIKGFVRGFDKAGRASLWDFIVDMQPSFQRIAMFGYQAVEIAGRRRTIAKRRYRIRH